MRHEYKLLNKHLENCIIVITVNQFLTFSVYENESAFPSTGNSALNT